MADHAVELYYDGAWHDITGDVRESAVIAINRGRRDWASGTDGATCKLKLNNGESAVAPGVFGRYSTRNALSDLYGKIGRNTPLRVRVGPRRGYLYSAGTIDPYMYASTPDHAAFATAGNFRVEVELEPASWRQSAPAGFRGIARQYDRQSTDNRAWALRMPPTGIPRFSWSTDGTNTALNDVDAPIPIPTDRRVRALAVTLNLATGAVSFEIADGIDGTWNPLGGTVPGAGPTSIFNSTAPVEIGRTQPFGYAADPYIGRIYAFRLYRGGTLVADADFRDLEPDTAAFTDSVGRPWTVQEAGFVRDASLRFAGEVASWPIEWDLSGADLWSSVEAASIRRRLDQGGVFKSSLFRDLSTRSNVAVYYPMEEPAGATRFASGLTGDRTYLTIGNMSQISLAASDLFVASDRLPTIGATIVQGGLPTYTPNASQRFVFLMAVPSNGIAADRVAARFYTAGTMGRFELWYLIGGGARIKAYDNAGTLLFDNGPTGTDFNGQLNIHSLWLEQQGADLFYQWSYFPLGGTISLIVNQGTIAGATFERFTKVQFGTTGGMENTVYGHAALLNGDVNTVWDIVGSSLSAWSGETGIERLQRLAADEALPAIRQTGPGDTETMGPQRTLGLVDLLDEVPTADMGLLTDRPDVPALAYRPRQSLYNQDPKLILDYATGVISAPFRPIEDDQATRNKITVNRVRGSSFTAVAETGPLSIQDPPEGVGVYDYSQEVNIDSDDRLPAQAGWRLHLGTIDAARYPTLRLNLRNPRVAAMRDDVLAVEEGDLIQIINLPPQVPPGPLDLFVEGISEEIGADTHEIEFNSSPGEAWSTFVLDDDILGRLDTAGSQLALPVDATATQILVATDSGKRVWMTFALGQDAFDIAVGGEVMRVIANADTYSPQMLTVERGINGIIKSHPAGTSVSLDSRHVIAL
jgi:hypothetical protein